MSTLAPDPADIPADLPWAPVPVRVSLLCLCSRTFLGCSGSPLCFLAAQFLLLGSFGLATEDGEYIVFFPLELSLKPWVNCLRLRLGNLIRVSLAFLGRAHWCRGQLSWR